MNTRMRLTAFGISALVGLGACGQPSGSGTRTAAASEAPSTTDEARPESAQETSSQESGNTESNSQSGNRSNDDGSTPQEGSEGAAAEAPWRPQAGTARLVVLAEGRDSSSRVLRFERQMLDRVTRDLEAADFDVTEVDVISGTVSENEAAAAQATFDGNAGFAAEWDSAEVVVLLNLRTPHQTSRGAVTMGLRNLAILRAPNRAPLYEERANQHEDNFRHSMLTDDGSFIGDLLEAMGQDS